MSTPISAQQANNEKLNKKISNVTVNIIILFMFIIIFLFTLLDYKIPVYICTVIGSLLVSIPTGLEWYKYISKRHSDKETTNNANSDQDDN